jgi:Divergent InlB B-repeat domain
VQRAGGGSGTVTSNVAAINCGISCSQVYDVGTSVTLTATPASRSTFSGWSGAGCSGTGTCTSIVTSDESVTATFTHGSSGAPGSPGSPGSPGTRTPKCTLKALSTSILLTAPKKRKHGKLVRPKFAPGALPIVVRCDQGARVTLTATVTEPIGKKPKRGKQRTKTIRLGPARISVRGNAGQTITLQLPHGLLADLKHHAKMSVALTLAATGSRGTGHVTGRIAALTGI